MSKNKLSQLSRTPKSIPTLESWKPEANDVIIPLMGPTGAGKSTFINSIAGKEVTTVGHDLKSCTAELLPVVIDSSQNDLLKDRRLVLVDTPGFGDTYVNDVDILENIGFWLETMYDRQHGYGHKGETKLAGIVYLHDISLKRMLGSTRKNFDVFQKLCGKDALMRVVLCTTKWSDINQEEGERQTEQLKENYWKETIEGGSTVRKFEDSQKSAWDVIAPIIEQDQIGKMDALEIQEELVEAKKLIPDTKAGRQLRYSLDELLKSLKQASSKDSSRRKELDAQIAAIHDQMKALHIPVTKRILRLLDLGVDQILDKFMFMKEVAKKATKLTYEPLPDDIIILVMGPTGVGKSTFINYLARASTKVGRDMNSCTTELQPVIITSSQHPQLGGQRLVIVDTPGFDDTYRSDSDILGRITSWLAAAEMKLGGVIYLYDISLSRMLDTTRNLEVVQKLCGEDTFRSVILGTTKWREVFKKDGEMRTQHLCDNCWRDMLDHGSKVFKFEDSSKSAWTMVDSIVELNRSRAEVLQIQRELVDAHKLIPDTEAGQKLRNDLDQVLKKLKEDRKAQKQDESKRLELDNEIAQVREQMKFMQVPVSQRVLGFLSLGIDKILDAVALSAPAPESSITRLAIDCDRLVLLFGDNREVKSMLLKLLSAQGVDVGNDQNAPTQEIKCWSVGTNEETFIIIDTPDFDSSSNPGRVVQRTRIWLETSCREDMKLGVVYLKLNGSTSGTSVVSLQANKLPTSRVTPRPIDSTLQSLSNNKVVSNGPSELLAATSLSPPNTPVISPTGARPLAPPSETKTDVSFPPSPITPRSNDASPPAAPKEGRPTTMLLGDEGITSGKTVVHPVPTKQPVSPGLIPRLLRSKGPQARPSPTPLPADITGSSLSAMELFQGLPSADTILFASLTTRPNTHTSKEVSKADDVPYVSDASKVVEFQNTPEAAQAMLHLSLKKTLPVGVLLNALISLERETTKAGGMFKRNLRRHFGSLFF